MSHSQKLNDRFLLHYIALDRDLAIKLGLTEGGLSEYVNRLNNAKFAPGRDEVLPRLVRYRNIRNKVVHELSTMNRLDQIRKDDITWIKNFDKAVLKKKDPLSLYLRRARAKEKMKNFRRVLVAVGISAAVLLLLALILYFVLR